MKVLTVTISMALKNPKDYKITKDIGGPNRWVITKKSDGTRYQVQANPKTGKLSCTCQGYVFRQNCGHLDLIPKEKIVLTEEVKKKLNVTRFPRSQVEAFIPKIGKILDAFGTWEIVGSYRRKLPTLKDVDILLVCEPEALIKLDVRLRKLKDYVPTISGKELIRGLYKNIPIDVQRVNKKEYPTYLLYRTGPKDFNIMMRTKAKKQGFKLNEHGLFDKNGKAMPVTSERSVFKHLGIEYIKPEARTK